MNDVLKVSGITCRYRDFTAVKDLSLTITQGQIACLLGPSGCGKTTALRAIAGFQTLKSGEIHIGGECMSTTSFIQVPEKRRVGMVFQEHALFPHQNAGKNVAAGLHGFSKSEKNKTVGSIMERVGLAGYEKRYPHELSGGQQQRVALARALAPSPSLLLMDEPFSNLDADLRERLGVDVQDLLKEQNITCLLVTHDQQDAFALGEQVGVMNDGKILQWDTPFNLYHEPANRFIADFVGSGVLLPGTLVTPETVKTEIGEITGNRAYGWGKNAAIDVLIRPDDVVPDEQNELTAHVVRRAFKGAEILYTLKLPSGSTLLSLFPSHSNHAVGERVGIRLEMDHLVAFLR